MSLVSPLCIKNYPVLSEDVQLYNVVSLRLALFSLKILAIRWKQTQHNPAAWTLEKGVPLTGSMPNGHILGKKIKLTKYRFFKSAKSNILLYDLLSEHFKACNKVPWPYRLKQERFMVLKIWELWKSMTKELRVALFWEVRGSSHLFSSHRLW